MVSGTVNRKRAAAVPALVVVLALGCGDRRRAPTHPVGNEYGEFMFVETPAIQHTRDYYPFAEFVNPEAPTDWLYPVNYVDGKWRMIVEVLELKDPSAMPVYYTITWFRGDGVEGSFLRAAVLVDGGLGTYESYGDIRELEYVDNGYSGGPVGNSPWSWNNAWRSVAGDLVAVAGGDRVFPAKVKVSLFIHAARDTSDR
jgi:hypothetical protein